MCLVKSPQIIHVKTAPKFTMELVLVIVGICIAAVEAGIQVGKVEAESIRLHLHGEASDQGFDGESVWSCTRKDDRLTDGADSHGWGKEQLVFVQQEPTHYKHKVIIKGLNKAYHNTTVYVLPANNTHQIDVHAETTSRDLPKPGFFFLKNNPLQSESDSVHITATNSTGNSFNYTNPI